VELWAECYWGDEIRSAYSVLVKVFIGKAQCHLPDLGVLTGMVPVGRHGRKLIYYIKTNLKEIGWKYLNCIRSIGRLL
jgi:hypothetical protein